MDTYISDSSPNPKYLTPHVLSEWMVEVCRFEWYLVLVGVLGLTCGVISIGISGSVFVLVCWVLAYYILYSIIILYYTLLSSVLPLLPLFPPFPPFLSQSSSVLPSSNIHSIRVGTWICLFILQSHLRDILTPHKLTEWMVEVCRFY